MPPRKYESPNSIHLLVPNRLRVAIYASRGSSNAPIKNKDELVTELEGPLGEARTFCTVAGVELDAIAAVKGLERTKLIGQAVEALISPDDRRRAFFRVVSKTVRAYKALLPDERAAPYLKPVATLHVVGEAKGIP